MDLFLLDQLLPCTENIFQIPLILLLLKLVVFF